MIGSEALKDKHGFGSEIDILYCCLFAEGDNRILKQKITRDQIKMIKNKSKIDLLLNYTKSYINNSKYLESQKLLLILIKRMSSIDKKDYSIEWNNNINIVNKFAEMWAEYKIDKLVYTKSNL